MLGGMPMENKDSKRAFNEMYMIALKRLENKSPEEIAKNAGVEFCKEDSTFKIKSLDKVVELAYPSYKSKDKLDDWYILILLHYLDLADGTPLYHQAVHFGELKDGLIRGSRFDKTVEREFASFLSDKKDEDIINLCKSLGGEIIKSKFDLSVVFYLFPNYPVTLNIWFADDEFGAACSMLVDKSADNYLTIEDDVVAGEFMLRYIFERYNELYM